MIVVTLASADATVVMDCETPDANGNIWVWTKLEGWWDPPEPRLPHLTYLQDVYEVTNASWAPREVTLDASADCRAGDLNAARDTLTQVSTILATPGDLTVDDGVQPRFAKVYLAGRPTSSPLGNARGLEVSIPLIAYDVWRHDTPTTGVI